MDKLCKIIHFIEAQGNCWATKFVYSQQDSSCRKFEFSNLPLPDFNNHLICKKEGWVITYYYLQKKVINSFCVCFHCFVWCARIRLCRFVAVFFKPFHCNTFWSLKWQPKCSIPYQLWNNWGMKNNIIFNLFIFW